MDLETRITEQPSHYDHLEQMPVAELLQHINEEDALVAKAVKRVLPQITRLVEAIEPRMKQGGRLLYVGAGEHVVEDYGPRECVSLDDVSARVAVGVHTDAQQVQPSSRGTHFPSQLPLHLLTVYGFTTQ